MGWLLLFVECFDKVRGMYVCRGFPWVMGSAVSFPSDSILLFFPSSKCSCPYNFFDFPFWFVVNDFWGRFQVVWAVDQGLMIGGEEWGMEDIVYLPMGRQHKSVGNIWYYFWDSERSVSMWLELFGGMWYREVCSFEPNFVPFLVWHELFALSISQQMLHMGGCFVSEPSKALNKSAPFW